MNINAQVNGGSPGIGEPLPDFILTDVHYHSARSVRLSDFRGKWLVLDFWTKHCASCVASFPRINKEQDLFRGKAEYLLIGLNSASQGRGIQSLYEKFRKHYNLNLKIAYDSILFERFHIKATPYILVIDPNGIVRKISHEVTARDLNELINGNSTTTRKETLFSVILEKWKKGEPQVVPADYRPGSAGNFAVRGLPMISMLMFAYFGAEDFTWNDSLYNSFSNRPVLEMKDPSLFKYDFSTGDGIYSYQSTSSLARDYSVRKKMLQDLIQFLGCEVSVETRNIDCWLLTLNENYRKSLRTKGGNTTTYVDHAGIKYHNVPVKSLIDLLKSYHPLQPNFIDSTGMKNNVDISFSAILTDFDDLKNALKKNGLILRKETREMKVLVVKDAIEVSLEK